MKTHLQMKIPTYQIYFFRGRRQGAAALKFDGWFKCIGSFRSKEPTLSKSTPPFCPDKTQRIRLILGSKKETPDSRHA